MGDGCKIEINNQLKFFHNTKTDLKSKRQRRAINNPNYMMMSSMNK